MTPNKNLEKFQEFKRLHDLIHETLDDTISPARAAELQALLQSDRDARRHYWQLIHETVILSSWAKGNSLASGEVEVNIETASTVDLAPPAGSLGHSFIGSAVSVVAQAIEWHRHPVRFLTTIAVLTGLFLSVLLFWIWPRQASNQQTARQQATHTGQPASVAKIINTHQVQEASSSTAAFVGAHLRTGQTLRLKSGLVELRFQSGARAILQGQSTLTIEGPNSSRLEHGKLVALVPPAAVGFSVTSPQATIIDLGTEFGMAVTEAAVEVAMFAGRVNVQVNDDSGAVAQQQVLRAGQSARIARRQIAMATLADKRSEFVRKLPTPLRTRSLDLADMVAGGDGQQTLHRRNAGIDLLTGQPLYSPVPRHFTEASGDRGQYRVASANRWVDGVFLPDGEGGRAVQIASTGLTTRQIPDTDGQSYDHLWNGLNDRYVRTALDGVDYASQSILQMFANKGVTFDLQAVRAAHPDWRLARFSTVAGNCRGSVDYLVLVDGQIVFERRNHQASNTGLSMDVPLAPDARFLTLVVTDAGNGSSADQSFLGNPKLWLTTGDSGSVSDRNSEDSTKR